MKSKNSLAVNATKEFDINLGLLFINNHNDTQWFIGYFHNYVVDWLCHLATFLYHHYLATVVGKLAVFQMGFDKFLI